MSCCTNQKDDRSHVGVMTPASTDKVDFRKKNTFRNRITENFNPIGRITRKKHVFSQTKYFLFLVCFYFVFSWFWLSSLFFSVCSVLFLHNKTLYSLYCWTHNDGGASQHPVPALLVREPVIVCGLHLTSTEGAGTCRTWAASLSTNCFRQDPPLMYKPNNNCANIKICILSCIALPFSHPRDLNPQIIIQYNSTFCAIFFGTTPHASNRTADMTGWHASGDGMLSMQHCTLFQVAAEPTTMVAVDPAYFFRILRLRWYSWVFNSQPEYILTIS